MPKVIKIDASDECVFEVDIESIDLNSAEIRAELECEHVLFIELSRSSGVRHVLVVDAQQDDVGVVVGFQWGKWGSAYIGYGLIVSVAGPYAPIVDTSLDVKSIAQDVRFLDFEAGDERPQ